MTQPSVRRFRLGGLEDVFGSRRACGGELERCLGFRGVGGLPHVGEYPTWGTWHGDKPGAGKLVMSAGEGGSGSRRGHVRSDSVARCLERHRVGSWVSLEASSTVSLSPSFVTALSFCSWTPDSVAGFCVRTRLYKPCVSLNTRITLGPERRSHAKRHAGPETCRLAPSHSLWAHAHWWKLVECSQNCPHDEVADAFFFFSHLLLQLSLW